ncbi:MAG: hypothetical protein J0I52_01205 [Bordetella sp.]|nr:hypothetical protein [Bordetella sp.]
MMADSLWLHFCFNLSFCDVEAMLTQRGIAVRYETIRCWTTKFGFLSRQAAEEAPAGGGLFGAGRMTKARCSIWSSRDGTTTRR